MPPPTPKHALRKALKQRLSVLSTIEQTDHAQSITNHLLSDPAINAASTILAYAAFAPELSLDPFIDAALDAGKQICLPRIDWATKSMTPVAVTNLATDLQIGRYAIPVPRSGLGSVPHAQLGVILLPALGYDRAGHRLGRGAGFYDRFISTLHDTGHSPTLIGVCHHAQIVGSVPTEPHDHRVDRVITELGPLDPVQIDSSRTPDPH